MSSPTPDPPNGAPGKSKLPDTFLILLFLALAAFASTWIFTPGRYGLNAQGRIDPASFEPGVAPLRAPLFGQDGAVGLLNVPFEGLVAGDRTSTTVGLMAFILVIGGVFGVLMRTGSIDRVLTALIGPPEKLGTERGDLIVMGLFVAFSLAGAVFGMSEEAIAISLILTPILVRSGYDSITGMLTCYVATQLGFATSWMNPFGLVIAQSISGLPTLSGMGLRLSMWVVFTLVGVAYLGWYARRVRRDPASSAAFHSDARWRDTVSAEGVAPYRAGDLLVLTLLLATVAWVAWGVIAKGYYLAEIAAQFFAMSLAVGLVAYVLKLGQAGANDLVRAFSEGAAQLAPAALVVGIAKGVLLMIGGDKPDHLSLLNSLLHAMGGLTALLPDWATALGMLGFQSSINLVIVSGSGQAALTMPLMAPLADLAGVSRQTAVLAFQLGDGLTNIVAPTSASLMGCLAAGRLGFSTWLTFVWRPLAGLLLLAAAFILLAQGLGYQ